MATPTEAVLDPREQHFRIPGPRSQMALFLRYLPAAQTAFSPRRAVLYVHGATFASALSIAHRLSGRSWRDALCAAGFDVWGLDFYGFGGSDRYPEQAQSPDDQAPLCKAADAELQLEAAVRFVLGHQNLAHVSLISHSWGSMPVGRFAARHPGLIDRWVAFAPIAPRGPRRYETPPTFGAWRHVSLEDQWRRFVEDVPEGEPPVLSRAEFEAWGQAYLDSDPQSRAREPASVNTPLGPFSEIIAAWHDQLAWAPQAVQCPVLIVRGEWDGLVDDADARRLFDAFTRSPIKRDVKIGRGTHLMHLEVTRPALWRESIDFLLGDDTAPSAT